MVEPADTLVLEASAFGHEGSNPSLRTRFISATRVGPNRGKPPSVNQLDRIEHKLDVVLRSIKLEIRYMTAIDDALTKLQADLTAETNASAAIVTLLTSVNQQLQAALANQDSATALAQVQAISASLETNTASLVAATVANTPAAPTQPAPAPTT